ncbi:MAG TPA: hypothetical protein VKX49_22300 [Bryobacteraceae bacterium]|nr:hypothetical protein [Bryobacteraceae bacterium]
MKIRKLAFGLLAAGSMFGQRFSWQDACFKNPGLPYCQGHEFAVKKTPPSKSPAPQPVISGSSSAVAPRRMSPSVIVVGGIDWRFVDPQADAVAGFNFSAGPISALDRSIIQEFARQQGFTGEKTGKILDALSGVGQIVLSVRGNETVAIVTGGAADAARAALDLGWKLVPLPGNDVLIGPAEAVDGAAQRVALQLPLGEMQLFAEQQAARGRYWLVAAGWTAGPKAVAAGLRRIAVSLSVTDQILADAAFEFNGPADPNVLPKWQANLGGFAIDGGTVHFRTAIGAPDIETRLGAMTESPLGQQLGQVLKIARSLPAPDDSTTRSKPVIYGLDNGPQEVNH